MNIETLKPLCDRCILLSKKLSDQEKIDRVNGLINTLMENPDWPDFKIGTWLGCAETILIESGISSYEDERNNSRSIKHNYYKTIGISPPPTIDVLNK
jgi:hypothetical protein